ncbi:PREDICTED: protocadherin Fat 1-like, partial [Priapulus caudatus]|uniref:Protocadherin Fat 1-like n=1 Tax=Priapulus caudatus TaxID=37621 RepID=A0ABM1F487_PRICU
MNDYETLDYSIVGGNTDGMFRLYEVTDPMLILQAALDYNLKSADYSLIIEASDGLHVTSTTVEVTVLDTDRMPPMFQQDTYTTSVIEKSPPQDVVTVMAADQDRGLDAAIVYEIVEVRALGAAAADAPTYLEIDPTTGVLRIVKPVDRDNDIQHFYVTIKASEEPNPDYRYAYCTVDIKVIDINDHDPEFDPTSYDVSIQENSPAGTFVAQVYAVDIDE